VPESLPIQYAQSLLKLSQVPLEELQRELQELNLPLVLLKEKAVANARISVDDYGRLFMHLIRKLQPELAADSQDLDSALHFSAYRMMFLAMAHSSNLGQAMQRASVYFSRFEQHGDTFVLEQDDDSVCCHFQFTEQSVQREMLAADNYNMGQLSWLQGHTGRLLSLSLWHRQCGWFIGSRIELHSVELAQPPQPGNLPLTDVFGIPVTYNAPRYAFHFQRRYLDFPIVQGEAAVARMLETFPAEILKFDPRDERTSTRVRNLIGTDFNRDPPGLQEVAERLLMTTPTLHRRLREEETSFQQIKDEVRRDLALDHLLSSKQTSAQIAELLGFSDASTFHRAFKKWTGQTPQEYRLTNSPAT